MAEFYTDNIPDQKEYVDPTTIPEQEIAENIPLRVVLCDLNGDPYP